MLKTGESVSDYETVSLQKEGARLVQRISAVPLRDANGRITGVVGTSIEMSQGERSTELEQLQNVVGELLDQIKPLTQFAQSLRLTKELEAQIKAYGFTRREEDVCPAISRLSARRHYCHRNGSQSAYGAELSEGHFSQDGHSLSIRTPLPLAAISQEIVARG